MAPTYVAISSLSGQSFVPNASLSTLSLVSDNIISVEKSDLLSPSTLTLFSSKLSLTELRFDLSSVSCADPFSMLSEKYSFSKYSFNPFEYFA